MGQFLPLGLPGWNGIAIACICLSVVTSVCLSVNFCLSTHHRFELESPNLLQTCNKGYSLLLLNIGIIDLDFQGQFDYFDSEFKEMWLVRKITRHRFGLDSPNLHQNMHSGILLAGIENEGHCPWDNLWWIWARITKFVPSMHFGIPSVGIVNRGHWPWPSRSFGHFNMSKKWHSTLVFYTDLGRPRNVARPKLAHVRSGRCFITLGELCKWVFRGILYSRIELAPRCYGTFCAGN